MHRKEKKAKKKHERKQKRKKPKKKGNRKRKKGKEQRNIFCFCKKRRRKKVVYFVVITLLPFSEIREIQFHFHLTHCNEFIRLIFVFIQRRSRRFSNLFHKAGFPNFWITKNQYVKAMVIFFVTFRVFVTHFACKKLKKKKNKEGRFSAEEQNSQGGLCCEFRKKIGGKGD